MPSKLVTYDMNELKTVARFNVLRVRRGPIENREHDFHGKFARKIFVQNVLPA